MKTFVRVIEYWVPNDESGVLEFGGGVFGPATRFEAASRGLCFGRGEGLPGQAWELGRPVVLKDFEHSYFRRAAAARAEGLTCGIALPIFIADRLRAVVVIFCGDDEAHAGAIELWANDPAESKDMTLVDGYYGTTGDTFEFISRSTSFRRGTGLPGLAWAANTPVFLPDLGKGSGFLRSDGAVKVGINRGFAVPCSTQDGSHCVMTFLSALATPIARRVEVWAPDTAAGRLVRRFSFADPAAGATPSAAAGTAESSEANRHAAAERGDGSQIVMQAFNTGVPAAHGSVIAVPVAPQGRLTAVMALHLEAA